MDSKDAEWNNGIIWPFLNCFCRYFMLLLGVHSLPISKLVKKQIRFAIIYIENCIIGRVCEVMSCEESQNSCLHLQTSPHRSRNSVEMTFFMLIFVAIGGKMYARFANIMADSLQFILSLFQALTALKFIYSEKAT